MSKTGISEKITNNFIRTMFFQTYAPGIRHAESMSSGRPDLPLRSMAWHQFLDMLVKDNQISVDKSNCIKPPGWVNGESIKIKIR